MDSKASIFPPERILYTDVNGGQILGYTIEDLYTVLNAVRIQAPSMRLTTGQIELLAKATLLGSIAEAGHALGISRQAAYGRMRTIFRRFPGYSMFRLMARFGAEYGFPSCEQTKTVRPSSTEPKTQYQD